MSARREAVRTTVDVSALPSHAFGHRSSSWWGTVMFMLIEGTVLAICAASYLYLYRNFEAWPPLRTRLPDLVLPTFNLAFLVASLLPAYWTKQAAERWEIRRMTRLLVVSSAIGLVAIALRWFEFESLNTRWDSNAYGSVVWAILGFHGTLLVLDVFDTLALTYLAVTGRLEKAYVVGTSDNAVYWFFMVLAWIPLYVLVFLVPRFA